MDSKYQLTDIEDCFIENGMHLDILKMDNPNFKKLMVDPRILMKSHLIQNIIDGLNALQELQKHDDNKMIIMTKKENKVLSQIQEYMNEINGFEKKLNHSSQF